MRGSNQSDITDAVSEAGTFAVNILGDEHGVLATELFDTRDRLLAGVASIEGIELPIPHPELSIIVYRATDISVDQLVKGMEERGWVHFTVHEPELIELVVDPAIAPLVDTYLADLADVVAQARSGRVFEGNRAST